MDEIEYKRLIAKYAMPHVENTPKRGLAKVITKLEEEEVDDFYRNSVENGPIITVSVDDYFRKGD